MSNAYTTPPMPPQTASRPAPKWARKRYVLPALAVALLVGAGIGSSGQDSTTDQAQPTAAKPRPTVTITATATATETAEPEAAPTVTTTETVEVTRTVTAQPAVEDGAGSDDSGGSGSVYYDNCSDARAAGAAPVYAGEPGYGSHLDRDGDGVGCE